MKKFKTPLFARYPLGTRVKLIAGPFKGKTGAIIQHLPHILRGSVAVLLDTTANQVFQQIALPPASPDGNALYITDRPDIFQVIGYNAQGTGAKQ